jgi:hypothetical protein
MPDTMKKPTPNVVGRIEDLHHLALLPARQLGERRQVGHVRRFGPVRNRNFNFPVADPVRLHRGPSGPVVGTPVDLAPLDRKIDLAATGIAGDELEFRAEHGIGQRRDPVVTGADTGRSHHQLDLLGALERGCGGGVPDTDDSRPRRERSEPLQLLWSKPRVAHQRHEQRGAQDLGDRRAVLGPTWAMYSTAAGHRRPGICIRMTVGLPGMCRPMWSAASLP